MVAKSPVIKIRKEHPAAYAPVLAHEGAVGYDLAVLGSITLPPSNLTNRVHPVGTGLYLEMPEGYYATLHLRSTWASKTKVRMANGVGVINPDYRGEIILYLENMGKYEQRLLSGQYIAEIIFHKADSVKVEVIE